MKCRTSRTMDRYTISRRAKVDGKDVENLRASVGWDRMDGQYDQILPKSYAQFTATEDKRLVGFLNVISDGIGDALLVDLMIHPEARHQGLGKALVRFAIEHLLSDGIRCIQTVFNRELVSFYQACGFDIIKAGIIDRADPKRSRVTNR